MGEPDERRVLRISKFLAKHLRHEPERIGITLDAHGWVEVGTLLAAAAEYGFTISRAELERVVSATTSSATGSRTEGSGPARATRCPWTWNCRTVEPPPFLFHGTVARNLAAIRVEGLRPMTRHHVHLSPDRETATRVGARRGAPVVLAVDAGAMHEAGHAFRLSANGVWLAERVPPAFIRFPG